jgi:hypothetical protein
MLSCDLFVALQSPRPPQPSLNGEEECERGRKEGKEEWREGGREKGGKR